MFSMNNNNQNLKIEYKQLLSLIAILVVATIVAKEIMHVLVVSTIRAFGTPDSDGNIHLSYMAMWGINALIVYTPSLFIFEAFLTKRSKNSSSLNVSRVGEIQNPASRVQLLLCFPALYFLSIVANMFTHMIASLFTRFFGTAPLGDPFANSMPTENEQWLIMLLFVGVVAPVVEEIIFRRMLLKPLRQFGDNQAVIITAVLFGAFHGNFTQFLYATVGGIVLGFVTVKSRDGSIKPAIFIHMANNIFTLTLAFMSDHGLSQVAATTLNGLAILGTISVVYLARRKFFTADIISKDSETVNHSKTAESSEKGDVFNAKEIAIKHPAMIMLAGVLLVNLILGTIGIND